MSVVRQPTARFALAALTVAALALLLPAAARAQSMEAARETARQALEANPEVTSRLEAYLGQQAAIDEVAAGWKPRLDMKAKAGIDAAKYDGGSGFGRVRHAGAGLSLSQVLWDGFATRNEVRRTEHERLARWFEFVDATEQTSLEALRALYDVQRQRKLVALAEDNVKQHLDAAGKIESRVKAGVGRGVDLDQVRARLALAQSNLDTEVANLHDVAARHMRVVGRAATPDTGGLEPLTANMPVSSVEAIQQAVERSPQVAAAIEGVRAARAGAEARKSLMQPRVEAFAEANGGHNLNASVGRRADAGVGVSLNWNLYNGGADLARQRQAASRLKQAEDQRDKACREVRQTVSIAWQEHAKLASQIGSLSRNTVAIDRARDAYKQQFDIGQRSLLDLLNAENESYTARRSATNAVYDRAVSAARTLAAMNALNATLGLSRAKAPSEAEQWKRGDDAPNRCPVEAVDVAGLRQGIDASLPWIGVSSQAPAAVAPVAAAPVALPAAAAATELPRAAAQPKADAGMPDLSEAVDAWARTQRRKDATGHLALYAPDFRGDEANAKVWRDKRKPVLTRKGSVHVDIADLQTTTLDSGEVETRFKQTVVDSAGMVTQDKRLTWARRGDGKWQIVGERGL